MVLTKITVLERTVNPELAKKLTGQEAKPCELFKDGQVFYTSFSKPEGFCEWAWVDMSRMFTAINSGGNFKEWLKRDGIGLSCCTDGLRPVVFSFERVESSALIDLSGAAEPAPVEAYSSERWGECSYAFPKLEKGAEYSIRLHFCEAYFDGAGKRRFGVDIGGRSVLDDFDVYREAGGAFKAIVKEFSAKADAEGGILIAFRKGQADHPKISAIEIRKKGEKASVYAVNCGGGAVGSFSADAHFAGGSVSGG
jgi:uncharacterized repeat protein (TIGR04076 family)